MDALANYSYSDSFHHAHHRYLDDNVLATLAEIRWADGPRRVFELGCGNGSFTNIMSQRGYSVTAIDPSVKGIEYARQNVPGVIFANASAYDDLAAQYGQFRAVVSLEVVEHVFEPRKYARCVFDLLEPGGIAIISTPYHSYLKNLALALAGKMDAHFTALWDFGHIKFWSIRTLGMLLAETGFENVRFKRVGRMPALAKSMIATARRP